MVFNGDKFEVLRFWPGKTPKPINQYRDPEGNIIEEKLHLRDLGVEISSDLSFSTHIENVASAGSRMVGWILITFRRRSKGVMITLWKTVSTLQFLKCSLFKLSILLIASSAIKDTSAHYRAYHKILTIFDIIF